MARKVTLTLKLAADNGELHVFDEVELLVGPIAEERFMGGLTLMLESLMQKALSVIPHDPPETAPDDPEPIPEEAAPEAEA